ncbi:hypothetical protein BX600DRAFT_431496 [Xylariales sp. PMI_506]|nr:hypothetical protein BX600DRAFT_431496 [Xylariales sp. PMI_506]
MIQPRRYSLGMLLSYAAFFALLLTSRHLTGLRPYYRGSSERGSGSPAAVIPANGPWNETRKDIFGNLLDDSCSWMPDTSNILVIMKSGTSELYSKLPTQLLTTLKCLPDFLIFSDMRQEFVGLEIYDSLDSVSPAAKDENPDFDLYRQQYECAVDQELCNKYSSLELDKAGWRLDKYKNVHIAEKAYRMRPDYDWYLTIDADTYVLWPNLVQWLSHMDPSKKRYLGSRAIFRGKPFAHGGSGYLVSQAAMREFVEVFPSVASRYDEEVRGVCCGDYMFAKALNDTVEIEVEHVVSKSVTILLLVIFVALTRGLSQWPTINGEKPSTLPFGEEEWCHPIVTMHHINSEEISAFRNFEQRFYEYQQDIPGESQQPILIRDVFHEFMSARLQEKRDNWDNWSDMDIYLDPKAKKYEDWALDRYMRNNLTEVQESAHNSFEDCLKMCKETGNCLQVRFYDGICFTSKNIVFGSPAKNQGSGDQRMTSGWAVSKIMDWANAHEYCGNINWPNI